MPSTASGSSSRTRAVSSPCPRTPITKYNDTFHAITAEARNALVDAVNDAYEQKLQEQQEQKGDAPDQAMSQQM